MDHERYLGIGTMTALLEKTVDLAHLRAIELEEAHRKAESASEGKSRLLAQSEVRRQKSGDRCAPACRSCNAVGPAPHLISDFCLLISDLRSPDARETIFDLRQFLRDGLRQCVASLLANAIKFAPGGEVTVAAAMTGAGGIEIRIADTGCGIPSDQLERVFEPFHQVENELRRATNGTGLGLPLSRKLAERHDGTLELEASLGAARPRSTACRAAPSGSMASGKLRQSSSNLLISCRN